MNHPLGPIAAFAAAAASIPAFAADTWTYPAPSVSLLERDTGTQRIHAAYVDLCAPGVSVRATRSSERGQTVSSFGASVGAIVAVNGDLFSSGFAPSGLAMGEGAAWSDTADNTWEASAVFGDEQAEITSVGRVLTTFQPWTTGIVSGRPQIVTDGAPLTSSSDSICGAGNPRTAVGLTQDRHTLLVVVVDGRQTGAVGLSCAELGATMADLGAHDALNFDGGGSSAMWVSGRGVVNDPSDGAERVVANHLAVLADGVSAPASCDPTYDAVRWDAHRYGARVSSDVTGDGTADACGRAPDGVLTCAPSDPGGAGWTGPVLDEGDADTLRAGDVDGDGRSELCARADEQWTCWSPAGPPAVVGPALPSADGWDRPDRAWTLRSGDVDGDGTVDLCGRASSGWQCWPSGGGAPIAGPALPDSGGWSGVRRFGSLRTGDIDGDGRDDLCALTGSRAACWRARDGGFEADPIDGPAWTDAEGWDDTHRVATFAIADVDGDGLADLVGRGPDGMRVARSLGSSFEAPIVAEGLADAEGWLARAAYGGLSLADLDDDGDLDLCGPDPAGGATCWRWSADDGAFDGGAPAPALPDDPVVRFADVTGDGRADLCGRDPDGLACWPSDGIAWDPVVRSAPWGSAAGWTEIASWSTVRLAGQWAASATATGSPTAAPTEDPSTSDPSSPPSAPPGLSGPTEAAPQVGCACASTGRPGGARGLAALIACAFAARSRRRSEDRQPR